MADSPVALAAWMIDHDVASYGHILKLFVDGEPYDDLTRDDILDNITLSWLTNTGVSSARYFVLLTSPNSRACDRTSNVLTAPSPNRIALIILLGSGRQCRFHRSADRVHQFGPARLLAKELLRAFGA